MRFSVPHFGTEFDIPDEWWREAGMEGFKPSEPHFQYREGREWPVLVVELSEVQPPKRNPGVANFGRERMVTILRAIAAGKAIPPIPVDEPPDAGVRYRLRDGFHRYHASVAVGFSQLPIQVLPHFDW